MPYAAIFLSSLICHWPLLAAAVASNQLSSLLPATAASASPSPPTTTSRHRCPLPQPPLFLSSLSPSPTIPAISLPSLATSTKLCRCSPATHAFYS
ncbi:hypothetical protein B296_00000953 [Ensete ventricosum]|uniref:Secreted protein n=1 Tax=Ensete ventricosum TaxID=4639 RepID=A0A427AF80_ENSVE|nr:hypothetical protein B296_00000953 [Ensete ventricosum]